MFAFMAGLLSAIEWLAYRLVERQWREEPSWVLIKRTWVFLAVVIWLAFIVNGFVWPTWRATHPRLLSVMSVSFFVVFVPKLILAGFEVLELVRGGTAWGVNQLTQSSSPISRKTFLTQTGVALSGAPELPLRRYVGEIRLSDRALGRSNQRASRWFERPQNRSDFRRAPRELREHSEACA